MRSALALPAMLLALAAGAQQPAPPVKFSVNSNLVIVDVTVKDKSGKSVDGLKAESFARFFGDWQTR